ncbi:hypothetical protein [Flavimarina sp. Hel_I_48]|uniref:hypothetical protein n=1 Tax=Flavimarina sp. Hel_I_48 TaxID=1392488 RepID=UPI0013DD3764|nr:hypothetical protein [Flavimarina sp. Hel_I_48]
MKKYIIIALLVVVALILAYLTFVIAAIKFAVGSVFVGIMVLAIFILWVMWKTRD